MKKFIAKVFILALAMSVAMAGAYAWYAAIYLGEAGDIKVSPAQPSNGLLLVSNAISSGYSAKYDCAVDKMLTPCTTADGKTMLNEAGQSLGGLDSDYLSYQELYLKNNEGDMSSLYVSAIKVTGDYEISKALRVSVSSGDITQIYAPVDGHSTCSYTLATYGDPFVSETISKGAMKVAAVRVWYEGTDASCTTENALLQDDSVTVTIYFGGAE